MIKLKESKTKLSIMQAAVMWNELKRKDRSNIGADLTQTESRILPENLTIRPFASLTTNQKRVLTKVLEMWLN